MPASAEAFGVDFFDSPTPAGRDLSAGTITISPGDSLQDAIDEAGNGGTVILNPGIYEVSGVECTGNVRIMSNPSAGGDRSNTIITSVEEGKSIIYGFWIGEIIIEGITLTNTSGRGAISNHGGKVVLISSSITDCNSVDSASGGGIYAGRAILTDSIIKNCHSSDGGGIFTYGDTTLINSTITGCSGSCGGAVYADFPGASVRVTDSIISDCYAEYYGGGICCNYNESSVTVLNTTFTDCLAGHNGGAICGRDWSIVTVEGCTITNCSTSDDSRIHNKYGGAVYGGEGSMIEIAESRISGSYADDDGGAVCGWTGSRVSIVRSSFEDCYASGKGGFLSISPGSSAKVEFSRVYNCDSNHKTVVYAGGFSPIAAENNWWGSNDNPSGYFYGDIDAEPWLVFSSDASAYSINVTETPTIKAGVYSNSDGLDLGVTKSIPDGTMISFSSSKDGRTISSQNVASVSGVSEITFSPKSPGSYCIYSSLDDEAVKTEIEVIGEDLPVIEILGLVVFTIIVISLFAFLYSGKKMNK